MAHDWTRIFDLKPGALADRAVAADESPAASGTALRRQLGLKIDPAYTRSDIADAVMTFCLVFTGAMMFLI